MIIDTSVDRSNSTHGIQEIDYRETSESGISQISKIKKQLHDSQLRSERSVSRASRNTKKEESSSTSLNNFRPEDKDDESFDYDNDDNQAERDNEK